MTSGSTSRLRRSVAVLVSLCASIAPAWPVTEPERPAFLIETLPPATCLSEPTIACLLAAFEATVSRFENAQRGNEVASSQLFRMVAEDVNDPAVDAMLTRFSPRWTDARLATLRDERRLVLDRAAAAAAAEPKPEPVSAAALPRKRAEILAIRDLDERVSRARATVTALIRAGRPEDADGIFKAVMKSLPNRPSSLGQSFAMTAARAYGEAGDWPSWSKSLIAGGLDRQVATAKTDGGPEDDPTDMVFLEPLRQGIPNDLMLQWLERARDPAFRMGIAKLMLDAAYDRGRMAAWTRDFPAFRRYVIDVTAGGEFLRRDPDNPFAGADEPLATYVHDQLKMRHDSGLALAMSLQPHLKPSTLPMDGSDRDRARERMVETLRSAMIAIGGRR